MKRVPYRKIASAVGLAAWVVGRVVRAAIRLVRRAASEEARPEWVKRLPGNRFALAGLVALAVLALYGVASVARPAAPAVRRPVNAPVTAASVVCPDVGGARIGALTPPGGRGAGSVRTPGTDVPLVWPGTAWSTQVKKASGAWTFGASGSLAAG